MSPSRAPSRRPFSPLVASPPKAFMSTPSFWANCLDAFKRELTPQQFNTWIRPLRLELAGDGLLLIAPNRFVLQWVKERFAARIEELAAMAMGRPLRLNLVVADVAEREVATPPPAGSLEPPHGSRRNEQASINPSF